MPESNIPPKFMRPRPYSARVGVNWRTGYRYINEGIWPAYKFQGILLSDVEECDAILKGMVRHVTPVSPAKAKRRPRKRSALIPKQARSQWGASAVARLAGWRK